MKIQTRSSQTRWSIPNQQRDQGEPQGSSCRPHMLCRPTCSLRWGRPCRRSTARSWLESRSMTHSGKGTPRRSRPGSSFRPHRLCRRPTCSLRWGRPCRRSTRRRRRRSSRLRSGCTCPQSTRERSPIGSRTLEGRRNRHKAFQLRTPYNPNSQRLASPPLSLYTRRSVNLHPSLGTH